RETEQTSQSSASRQVADTPVSQLAEEGVKSTPRQHEPVVQQKIEQTASQPAPVKKELLAEDALNGIGTSAVIKPELDDKANSIYKESWDKKGISAQQEHEAIWCETQQYQVQAEAQLTARNQPRFLLQMIAAFVLGAAISAAGFYQLRQSPFRETVSQLKAD